MEIYLDDLALIRSLEDYAKREDKSVKEVVQERLWSLQWIENDIARKKATAIKKKEKVTYENTDANIHKI